MKRKFTFLMAALALLTFLIPLRGWGQEVTLSFTTNTWGLPVGSSNAATASAQFTDTETGYTITLYATNSYYFNSSGMLMLGKKNSTLTLPAFSFDVDKIVVTGKSGASGSVGQNIYVGETAVSTATTGATTQNTYEISSSYQSAGTIYTLMVTTAHNTQITKIEIFKKVESSVAVPTFNPVSGTEFGNEGLSVTISQADNEDIYYTLDGTDPDNSSILYTNPISLTTTTTIKAIACDGTDYSSIATATYTYVDPNAPGTQNNPYTVAQARAAIDAGTGITGVFATGIISQVDSYNSTYNSITYWISSDGTTTSDQLEVYSGKGLNNTDFTSIDEVEVGATVVVYGTLKKYNTIYEFDKNNYLTSYTAPVVAVEAPAFNLTEGGYATTQNVTLTCATEGATIYYTTNGDEPDNNSEVYNGAIVVSTTTTIKAIAYLNSEASAVSAHTYYILSNVNNLTVTQALALGEYPVSNVFVHGIVSTAPTADPNNGTLTYYISVDGETTNQLQVYKGKGLNNVAFDAQDDIQLGDIVTIFGNLKIYNEQTEFDQGNYLVAFERPVVPSITIDPTTVSVDAQAHDGYLSISYENLNIADEGNFEVYFYESNGSTQADYSSWLDAEVIENNNAYVVYYTIQANTGTARTAYLKVYVLDEEAVEKYSDLVTISQEAAPQTVLYTYLVNGLKERLRKLIKALSSLWPPEPTSTPTSPLQAGPPMPMM